MLAANSRAHVDCVSRVLKNADRLPQAPVPALILDSWRRSMELYRLDPGSQQGPRILSQSLLNECRERAELFLRIASDAVARLHERVRGADYCVLLTDAQGRTIDYRVESAIRNDCRKAGLYLGTCWSEGEEGTCGVAAVLTSKAPVTVHKRDHFRAAFIGLTCTAAPVFDPQGELLGVVDVSALQSPDDRRSQHLIRQLVEQTAREIENAFFMHSAQGHWVMRAHGTPGYVESQPDYLLAWDADGRLQAINSLARQRLVQHLGRLPEHIGELFDMGQLRRVNTSSAQRLPGLGGLYGRVSAPQQRQRAQPLQQAQDARIEQHLRLATRVKDCNLAVLVQGETGAGKEVFARQLHQQSQRRDGPFVTLNCAAIPENLIESELFGYVAGAFTGASSKGMQGLLQQADGGTLFLDEIAEMPLEAQTSLLRVLQENEVVRIGASYPLKVNVRIIAATHCNLLDAVERGAFRRDLYYRLNVISLEIPPLRERQEDIPDLVNTFIHALCARLKRIPPQVSNRAMRCLEAWPWPGNVRELENLVERIVNLCDGLMIDLQDFPEEMAQLSFQPPAYAEAPSSLLEKERQHILQVIGEQKGNLRQSAQLLGISRTALYNKLNYWQVDIESLRKNR